MKIISAFIKKFLSKEPQETSPQTEVFEQTTIQGGDCHLPVLTEEIHPYKLNSHFSNLGQRLTQQV